MWVPQTVGGKYMGLGRADWEFVAEPRSVTQARMLLAESLDGMPEESLEAVLLMASELVTNAVIHGSGPVGLSVAWNAAEVRVDVQDRSRQLPRRQPRDPHALGGRGLNLVEDLASAWGVLAGATSKTVWFSLAL